MSDDFYKHNGLDQYYLQVAALTPSESPQTSQPVQEKPTLTFLQVYLPIALLVGFVGISIMVLFSKKALRGGGHAQAFGLFIIVTAIVMGTLNIKETIELQSKASFENTPQNVTVSEVSDSGFVISWLTDGATNAFIQVYKIEEPTATSLTFMSANRDHTRHIVEATALEADSDYAVRVFSDGEWFDLDGSPLIITTQP